MVYALCKRLSPDADDDHVWEKVMRALPSFDVNGPAALSTWIVTIAHRHLIDRHRRRLVRGDVLPLVDVPSSSDLDERLDEARRAEHLGVALQRLPADQTAQNTL
jgi:DNA-directed RNA polymerase specialized sigma24 family protein